MEIYRLRFRTINKQTFEFIKGGKKKVETRAATERYRDIKAGDKLTFVCGKNEFSKLVKRASVFKTIPGMLKKYKVTEINPTIKTAEELEKMYYLFPGYKEKIKKHGLIALELK